MLGELGDQELPDAYKRKAKFAQSTKKKAAESSLNLFNRGGSSIGMASGIEKMNQIGLGGGSGGGGLDIGALAGAL